MRTAEGSRITYDTAVAAVSAGQRSLFIQGEIISDVLARAVEQVAALAAEQGADWEISFIDLAGAGSGGQFMLELRCANESVADVGAFGVSPLEFAIFGSQAAQSSAAALAYIESLEQFIETHTGFVAAISQMVFAGASLGTPTGDITVGTAEPLEPPQ